METIKLSAPVTVESEEYTELEMRRPKVKDHIWIKTSMEVRITPKRKGSSDIYDAMDREVAMFARLCDVDEAVIRELDEYDWEKCQGKYLSFKQTSPNSKETSEIE